MEREAEGELLLLDEIARDGSATDADRGAQDRSRRLRRTPPRRARPSRGTPWWCATAGAAAQAYSRSRNGGAERAAGRRPPPRRGWPPAALYQPDPAALHAPLPKVAEVLPILYLRGLSTGDFRPALEGLLGEDAGGLSPTNIARLTACWENEYAAFRQRDLSGCEYVYVWVDGVHFNIRLEDDRLCTLVMIGARPTARRS